MANIAYFLCLNEHSGFQAEPFAAWLQARSGVRVPVQRPFDFMGLAVKVLGTFTAVFAVTVFARKGRKIFTSKYFWSTISMVSSSSLLSLSRVLASFDIHFVQLLDILFV